MATKKAAGAPPTVAEYLAGQIDMSEKTQREIAAEIGYDRPNILTMLKQGTTKIPLNKVAPLARALGVDPAYFIRVVLREYLPDMWDAIQECLGGGIATKNEAAMLAVIRDATKNSNPAMDTARANELRRWAKSLE